MKSSGRVQILAEIVVCTVDLPILVNEGSVVKFKSEFNHTDDLLEVKEVYIEPVRLFTKTFNKEMVQWALQNIQTAILKLELKLSFILPPKVKKTQFTLLFNV